MMTGQIESRLAELGIKLPRPAPPVATYVPYVLNEGVLHISGQLPFAPDGNIVTGILGADLGVERGAQAARYCAIMLMAQISEALDGDLDRVKRILKLGGFVASAPSFTDQPKVANGASDVMVEVFGDAGRHARSAVGVPCLPLNAAVEVDAIVAVSAG